MLDELKRAWADAVRNFRQELHGSGAEPEAGAGSEAASRALASARRTLADVNAELERSRARLAAERLEVDACRRRGRMARRIGDDETARIADRFAARHAEWSEILGRKVDALAAEVVLLQREIGELEALLARQARERVRSAQGGGSASSAGAPADPLEDPIEAAFQEIEDEARRRAAEERVSELKRRH